jgi:hypothetical protein
MSLINFVISPPGCGRSVTDFRGWNFHGEQLRCPDVVDGDTWIWSTRRGLNLSSTKFYPDNGHLRNLPLQGKIPMVEPGMKPGASWSVVWNSDH